jgi:transposase-like protein
VRRTASEKMEIIRLVEATDLPVRATLRQMNIPRSTFYNWYRRYVDHGFDGLHDKKPAPRSCWNAIPETIQKQAFDDRVRESRSVRRNGSGHEGLRRITKRVSIFPEQGQFTIPGCLLGRVRAVTPESWVCF